MKVILNEDDKRDLANGIDIICIYKLTNLLDNKIYIGQTVNFRKRVSDYRNAANKKHKYPIYLIIAQCGEENFSIEILERCTETELNRLESQYITKYDSTNSDIGYNRSPGICIPYSFASRRSKSVAHLGLKETPVTKRKKSNRILAIKGDTVIIADSGKLFGDYIGKSKDYIKNCLRQPSNVCGYDLFYYDNIKRNEIKEKMLRKRSIRNIKFMELIDMLDECENESVETIYSLRDKFSNVYELTYDNNAGDELSLIRYDDKNYIIFIR